MNVGLLTVSSWLLASAALQPSLTYLGLAIVGFVSLVLVVRYVVIFERYTSHRMAFLKRRTKTHKDTDNFLVTVGGASIKHPN